MAARTSLFISAGLYLVLVAPFVTAQVSRCYTPGGSDSRDTLPCGTGNNVMCCPYQWQCLSNGLCFNPVAQNLMGRYGCTSGGENWVDGRNSGGCPKFCDQDASRGGNEAVLACDDGRWCCNKDRQAGNCCTDPGFTFVNLTIPEVYATINRQNAVGASTTGPGPNLPSAVRDGTTLAPSSAATSNAAQTTDASSSEPTSEPPTTIRSTGLVTRVSTGAGGPVTVIQTEVQTIVPTTGAQGDDNNSNQDDGGSSSNIGLIVGCAVGIPLGLAIFGLAFFFLRRRRNKDPYKDSGTDSGSPTGTGAGAAGAAGFFGKKNTAAKHSTDSTFPEKSAAAGTHTDTIPPYAVEIDGTETTRPTSELPNNETSRPVSELYGSTMYGGARGNGYPSGNSDKNLAVTNERDSIVSSLSPSLAGGGFANGQSPHTPSSISTPQSPTAPTFASAGTPATAMTQSPDLRSQGAAAAHFGGGGNSPTTATAGNGLSKVDEEMDAGEQTALGQQYAGLASQYQNAGTGAAPTSQYQAYRPPV